MHETDRQSLRWGQSRMTQFSPPRKLRIELGLDCPLLCQHCSANAAPGHPLAMSVALANRLVREFAEMGGQEVTFTGGEPLVNPHLPSLLKTARMLGLETVMFTSGAVYDGSCPSTVPSGYVQSIASTLDCAVFSV